MAVLSQGPLTPLIPAPDPLTQRITDLEARVAKLEGVVRIQASGDVTIKVGQALAFEAGTGITCKAGSSLDLVGGTTMTIKASAGLSASAGATMTLKGSVININ